MKTKDTAKVVGGPLDPEAEVSLADLFVIVKESVELRSALRDAISTMAAASDCLTVGMKAGVSEAKATLNEGRERALNALRSALPDTPEAVDRLRDLMETEAP